MLSRRSLLLSGFCFAEAEFLGAAQAGEPSWSQADKIVARITPPRFPQRIFNIAAFGARDGQDCSGAIARAIAAAHDAGGGRVLVPAGLWLSGAIHLKSHVELHLQKGATIRFVSDPKAYLPLVETRCQGIALMNYSPFIYARDQEDIAVTGTGHFDGGADLQHWWPWKGRRRAGWRFGMPEQSRALKRLEKMSKAGVPTEQRVFGDGWYLRPGFFEPLNCRNVLIEGVRIDNMPFWQIHPILCRNVTVRNVSVYSAHGPNTDGCDPESCRDVLIENCFFNTGDDCIAIKSGRDEDGRRQHVPCENVVIRDCRMVSGHGAIAIGSEISGGAANIYAENCIMSGSKLRWGLLIKDNCRRGGTVRSVHLRHITVGEVSKTPVSIDFHYGEGAKGRFPPVVDDVEITDLSCQKCHRPWVLRGLAKAPLGRIRLANCLFRHPRSVGIRSHAPRLTFDKIRIGKDLVQF